MALVDMNEAEAQLSELLDRVLRGEEIVLARAGRPVARLVPVESRKMPRMPGAWRGKIRVEPDFDELPAEIAAAFRGERPTLEQRAASRPLKPTCFGSGDSRFTDTSERAGDEWAHPL